METTLNLSARSQQFHMLCRRWESDLEFFQIETAFLHRLLDDYFVRLLSPEFFDKLKETSQKLFTLERDESNLSQQLATQTRQLELTAESIIPEDAERLADTQITLESLLLKLISEYKEVKKELFALVENAWKAKKLIVE